MHVSALSAMVVFAYVLVVGFLWRWLSTQLAGSDNSSAANIGQAMSTLY